MRGLNQMITTLLYNSCTSCRKTEQVLKESGVEYERREFFKDRFTREELRSLLQSVNLTPADVFSTRSRVTRIAILAKQGSTMSSGWISWWRSRRSCVARL